MYASLSVSVSAQTDQAADDHKNYREEACYVSGVAREVRCFSLERALPDGGTVVVKGVIISSDAIAPHPDPLVILAGGPGQAATDMVRPMYRNFRQTVHQRDLIFFDIRGTGLSQPVTCEDYLPDADVAPLTHMPMEDMTDGLAECWRDNAALMKTFTTRTAVADLDALRDALGIEQINLWGGSYGTRFAQYYMVSHPDRVRSAILDAVVPFAPSYVTMQADNAVASLQALQTTCAMDDACASAFPDFDPIALLDQLPDSMTISYIHPVSGQDVSTTTSRTAVAGAVMGALYSPASRVWLPYALTQAVDHGNWAPMAAISIDGGRYFDIVTIYAGAFLGISCAEEFAAFERIVTDESIRADVFMRQEQVKSVSTACKALNVARDPLPKPKPGSIAIPTVMVSGGMDPITPPVMADHAARAYTNLRHVLIDNGGHINSQVPCVDTFVNKFIDVPILDDGEDDAPELECKGTIHVPAFAMGLRAAEAKREGGQK